MDNDSSALPRFCFDTSDFPEAERFEFWRTNIAPLANASLAPGVGSDQFAFRSEFVALGQTQLGRTWQRGIGIYHMNGTHSLRDAPEVFFLQTYLKGGFSGYHGSQAMMVEVGDIVLLDSIQPMHIWVGGDEELISLAIPHQMLLAELKGRFAPAHRIVPAADVSAMLLRQWLVTLWEQLPGMSRSEAIGVEAMLIGAVAGLSGAESPPQGDEYTAVGGAANLAVICTCIDQHLHEPELGIETLCQRFHCSRATLYRLFASLGGVAGYIRQQRLARCHADLQAARPGDTVSRIALRWGFTSTHHFSRLYRTAFGTTPGGALETNQS